MCRAILAKNDCNFPGMNFVVERSHFSPENHPDTIRRRFSADNYDLTCYSRYLQITQHDDPMGTPLQSNDELSWVLQRRADVKLLACINVAVRDRLIETGSASAHFFRPSSPLSIPCSSFRVSNKFAVSWS
jgi:hypothetical protein